MFVPLPSCCFNQTASSAATELAEKLGISRAAVSFIINGKAAPSLDRLEQIAAALGVRVIDLIDEGTPTDEACCSAPGASIVCPKYGETIPVELKVKQ